MRLAKIEKFKAAVGTAAPALALIISYICVTRNSMIEGSILT